MIVVIQDETFEFENDATLIQEYFDKINLVLAKKDLQFSHMVIDGVAVYNDIYIYITKNIQSIKKITVEVQSIESLVKETILSTFAYLNNAEVVINSLATEFYQIPNENTWKELINLFEGIQWIIDVLIRIDALNNLDKYVNDYVVWNKYVQAVTKLSSVMATVEEAMINKDNVLIGDLLLYEIVPIIRMMIENLKFLIPGKVNKDVS